MKNNNYDSIVSTLNKVRMISEQKTAKAKKILTEANDTANDDSTMDGIPITDDPKFGDKVLTNQINSFLSAVDSGAEFSKPDNENPGNSPLIFIPSNNNVILSGTIPSLNNLKFQFTLKNNTMDGCFLWSDGMILNEKSLAVLTKLMGYYENWRKQWNTSAKDLEPLKQMFSKNS